MLELEHTMVGSVPHQGTVGGGGVWFDLRMVSVQGESTSSKNPSDRGVPFQ